MKLTVLIDNQTLIDRYYRGEPGVSYWLETDGRTVLFDTGYSDLFLDNARKMAIEPTLADFVVLSHGHNDHSWGLGAFLARMTERQTEQGQKHRPTLVAHPQALFPKRFDSLDIGSQLGADTVGRFMTLKLARETVRLTDRLFWLGEVPRIHSFEPQQAIGETHDSMEWVPDILADDSALAYRGPEGLVIITGCSHAGICNIVSHAQAVTGETSVQSIVGGFHFTKPEPERLAATLAFFKTVGVATLYAGHCTGFEARAALAQTMDQREIGVGMRINF